MLRLQSVVVRSDSCSWGLSLGQLNSGILLRPAEKQEKSWQQWTNHHKSRCQQPTFPHNSTITPQLLGNGNECAYSQITTPTA